MSIKVSVLQTEDNQIFLGVCTKKLLNCYDIWKRSESAALYFENSSIIKVEI